MKIYQDYSPSPDEWDKTSILELHDDGHFSYHEILTCYGGSIDGKAEGKWRQSGDMFFFRPEQVEGSMYMGWVKGQEWKAFEQDDCLNFPGSFTLCLRT